MEQFVFIFRKGSISLTDAEKRRVGDEGRAWSSQQLIQGRKLEMRTLGKECKKVSAESEAGSRAESPIVAVDFLQARDFTEAVEIAETHPALCYGLSVEVRPWTQSPARAPTREP